MSETEMFDDAESIGMSREDAVAFFKSKGYTMRVTLKDGQACIVTRDYRQDRINVAIQDGKVSAIRGVG